MKFPNIKQLIASGSGLTEKLLVLAVILYIGVSVGRSVMQNYQVNQQIDGLRSEIAALKQEARYLEYLINYYQTDTFKELQAREQLGWHLPGETVLSVPVEEGDVAADERKALAPIEEKEERELANYEKWYRYFFGA